MTMTWMPKTSGFVRSQLVWQLLRDSKSLQMRCFTWFRAYVIKLVRFKLSSGSKIHVNIKNKIRMVWTLSANWFLAIRLTQTIVYLLYFNGWLRTCIKYEYVMVSSTSCVCIQNWNKTKIAIWRLAETSLNPMLIAANMCLEIFMTRETASAELFAIVTRLRLQLDDWTEKYDLHKTGAI